MRVDVGRENSTLIELQIEDLGFGRPVLLVHGWPVASLIWERQAEALIDAGLRVISVDRRGFGRSSRATTGYDLDTLAEDLQRVIEVLDLHDAALVGYGLGCSEILRYVGNAGDARLRSLVLVAPLPSLPGGQDEPWIAGLRRALRADRHQTLERHLDEAFRRVDDSRTPGLGAAALHALWSDAARAAPRALLESLAAWAADLSNDLPRIGVPTLVLQGEADHALSPTRAAALADQIAGAQLQLVPGASHGLLWTHTAEVNSALLAFLT